MYKRQAYTVADLSPAYANDVSSAQRGLFLTHNRNVVILQDEVALKAPSEVWWFAHIYNKTGVQIADDGKSAILTQGGQRLWAVSYTHLDVYKRQLLISTTS